MDLWLFSGMKLRTKFDTIEAMENGIDNGNIREGRYISGTASNGLRFEGYIDSTTNTITNFHPVLD